MHPPRLKDIAKRAGVSIAAASIALNKPDTKRVSAAKQKEILAIAKELGFVPNALAKALAERHTHLIGLMVPVHDPNFFNYFNAQVLSGIQATLMQRGYQLLVYSPTGKPGRSTRDQILESRFTDGVIFMNTSLCTTREVADTIQELDAAKIKFAMMNSYYGRAPINYIGVDDTAIGKMAVTHLASRGHSRIAFLSVEENLPTHIQLLQGLHSGMEDCGLALTPELIGCTGYDKDATFRILDRWFSMREKPTAIFCGDDPLLLHLYDYMEARNLTMPGDVAVLGRGVSSLLNLLRPRPTAFYLPTFEMGKLAAEMLIHSIENPEQQRQNVLLPFTLHQGETT